MLWSGRTEPSSIWFVNSPGDPREEEALSARRANFIARLRSVSREHAGRLIALNTWDEYSNKGDVGIMSYPNYGNGPRRGSQTPDLVVLAALAAEAGVELRVLVLLRSAHELIVSTTQHRSFASPAQEAATLSTAGASLASQLRNLDGQKVLCVPLS